MKQKYKISLFLIAILFTFSILLLTHYNIIMLGKNKDLLAIDNTGCISVIYSDDYEVSMVNPRSYSDEDGSSIIPNTITITNYCNENKDISLYIDLYNSSTISDNKMKISVKGDIELPISIMSDLSKIRGKDNISYTYKLFKVNINSFETKRINLRIWLDENETLNENKNTFDFKYYVLAGNSNNDSFSELLKSNTSDDKKYIKFANLMWQVVGLNQDNTIKIIYSDEELLSKFNNKYNSESSVSFENSTIKSFLDNFYNEKLSEYEEYISEENYCIDTSYTNNYSKILFGAYTRNIDSYNPSLECQESDKDYGGLKSYKIGLITADEVAIYNLYEDYDYYTISPSAFNNYRAYVAISKSNKTIDSANVSETNRVRPVINLKDFIQVVGSGTLDDPYVVNN